MKMTEWEKKQFRTRIKHPITTRHEDPPRIGKGRENERFECAANRRAADTYVQNY